MSSNGPGSTTQDLHDLRSGSQSATGRIVGQHWERLRELIRSRFHGYGRPAVFVDEDEVANAALYSLIIHLQDGEYLDVIDHNGFWRILAVFAMRRASRTAARERRRPDFYPLSVADKIAAPSRSPSSDVANAELAELTIRDLKGYKPRKHPRPRGEDLVLLVRLRAEGHDIEEIADRLGVARCTVFRWIKLAREIAQKRTIVRRNGSSESSTQ
jgi:DNA-directed RNA polymerase specialized sigma24 family protein